jgi:mono/diheme cytochrome c family protein
MRTWISWLGVLLLAGCAAGMPDKNGNIGAGEEPKEGGISEVPNPTPAMAAKSHQPLDKLKRGHVAYMLNCGQCHGYMLPAAIDTSKWQQVMPKMIGHAGLEPEDEKAVLAYVLAVKAM